MREEIIKQTDSRNVWSGHFYSTHGGEHIYFRRSVPSKFDLEKNYIHLVMVHGFCEYHKQYLDIVNYLNKERTPFLFTWIDLKGHGLSGGNRAFVNSFEEYSYDLIQLLNYPVKVEEKIIIPRENIKTVVLGHNMGGLVALQLYLELKDSLMIDLDGIILSNPAIRFSLDLPIFAENMAKKVAKGLGKIRIPNPIRGIDLTHNHDLAENYDKDPIIGRFFTLGLLSEIIDMSRRVRSLSYFVDTPCLYLLSGKDKYFDYEAAHLFCRGAPSEYLKLKEYPDCSHSILNENNREEVYGDIRNWCLNLLKEPYV